MRIQSRSFTKLYDTFIEFRLPFSHLSSQWVLQLKVGPGIEVLQSNGY